MKRRCYLWIVRLNGILCIRRLAALDLCTCIGCAELDENGNAADKRTPMSTRASKDGQVPATWSFEKWFDSLSEEEQEKYLGVNRRKLYKDGKITFSSLIDQNGRGLTLHELKTMRRVFEGHYAPEYESKLWQTYDTLKAAGIDSSEHALNRIRGRLNSKGKRFHIESLDDIIDAYRTGMRYIDKHGGEVRFKEGVALFFAKNSNVLKTVTKGGKVRTSWGQK